MPMKKFPMKTTCSALIKHSLSFFNHSEIGVALLDLSDSSLEIAGSSRLQPYSSDFKILSFANSWNLSVTASTVYSPCTLLSLVLTLTVPLDCSFSPTTRMKLYCAVCALRTFLFIVSESSHLASAQNPASCSCSATFLAYSLKSGPTGTTAACLGDNQNGHLPPHDSVRIATILSTLPRMARWIMTGNCFSPFSSM